MDDFKDRERAMFFKEGLVEENPLKKLLMLIKNYREGKPYQKVFYEIKDILPEIINRFIEIGYLDFLRISKLKFFSILLQVISEFEEKEVFFYLIKKSNDKVEISLALSHSLKNCTNIRDMRFMDNEANQKKQKQIYLTLSWIKERIEKRDLDFLYLLKNMSKECQSLFLDQLLEIARKEIGKPQYLALEILEYFVDLEDVKKLFIEFLDDWDKEVKKRAILALSSIKEEEVRVAFEELREKTWDEEIVLMVDNVLKNWNK